MGEDAHSYLVDENLIRHALLRARGQIHAIVGIVAMYRAAARDSPRAAQIFEISLRRFVATGLLE